MSCSNTVQPLPYEFCIGCDLNGCYPWNRNPLLLCSKLGGLHLALFEFKGEELSSCLSFRLVTEQTWHTHIEDLKREAKWNEIVRKRAMSGRVLSNTLLPVEESLASLSKFLSNVDRQALLTIIEYAVGHGICKLVDPDTLHLLTERIKLIGKKHA